MPTARTCAPCAPRCAKISAPRPNPSPPYGRAGTSGGSRRSARKARRQDGVSRKAGGGAGRLPTVAHTGKVGGQRKVLEEMDTRIPGATANLWDPSAAGGLSELETLAFRSNPFGRDRAVANFGGGNT